MEGKMQKPSRFKLRLIRYIFFLPLLVVFFTPRPVQSRFDEHLQLPDGTVGRSNKWTAGDSALNSNQLGSNFIEVKKLMAGDAQTSDRLGLSLDISGDTLVVGATYEDGDSGNGAANSGAVYVFERNLGGANNWGQAAKLIASDTGEGDLFGVSVGIHEDTIAVGAYLEDGGVGNPKPDAGAAYIFERNLGGENNWGEAMKLTAGDAQEADWFGVSLTIHGDVLVVGATQEDGGTGDPLPDVGAVYVFERDFGSPGNWGQTDKLAASDAQAGDNFGVSVALHHDLLIIGAFSEDGGPGDPMPVAGAAYVFERDSDNPPSWGAPLKLTASDAEEGDRFGVSVAISEDTLVVGAFEENGDPPGPDRGAAYVFERNLGGADQWGEAKKITADDAEDRDYFGGSVAIHMDTIAVGAFSEGGGPGSPIPYAGAAYIFDRHVGGPDNWGQVAKLNASDPDEEDHFGVSVAGDGDFLAVGAYKSDGGPAMPDTGAAYLFYNPKLRAYLPAASSCVVLYNDDFSNPNSGWPVGDDGNILLEYRNGEYRIRILDPFWTAIARPGPMFTDYLLSANVRRINTNDGNVGLVFGLNSAFNQMFTFEIDAQRGYQLWILNGNWTQLKSGTSNALLPGLGVNSLAVERSGSQINLFANGIKIDSIVYSSLQGLRHVGVIASRTDDGPIDVRIDNFQVLPIGCGLSANTPVAPTTTAEPLEESPDSYRAEEIR